MSDGVSFTLGRLAEALGASLQGEPGRVVTGVAPLDAAGPDQISFLTDLKYRRQAQASRAGALLVGRDVSGFSAPLLQVDRPQQALITLLALFHPDPATEPGVHATACVAPTARVDASASIGPLAVVEADAVIGPRCRVDALAFVGRGAVLGEDVRLYPHVVVLADVRIGDRVIVHAGTVLGADGFGYRLHEGRHVKVPQLGGVEIGEIGRAHV